MMNIICLVCCRGGSKGIKNKNIKIFHGKPLLYWISRSIKKSKIFNKVYLSTDSPKIARIGKNLGFNVPNMRPKNWQQINRMCLKHSIIFSKKIILMTMIA